jgi:hypothetical protein
MADSTDITVQNGDTALVPVHSKTRAKMGFCNSPLLLPFGKSTFYVPSDAVVSIPKGTNRVENASVLNQIINTKSPPTWKNYLDPDRLLLIKGGEGTSVYTTFKVIDQTTHQEEMFIRHIPPSVCEKQFRRPATNQTNRAHTQPTHVCAARVITHSQVERDHPTGDR